MVQPCGSGSYSTSRSTPSPLGRGNSITHSYRAIRPWLTSTFDELIVYCRTTLLLSKKNHERLLIAFSAAMDQIYIGNKVGRFRVHSGEIVFPYFVGAVGEGGLCGVAIKSAHILLSAFSFDQLRGHALRRSVGD